MIDDSHALIARESIVTHREEVLAVVQDMRLDPQIPAAVRSLRRKLGNDIVRTVHGVGYAIGPAGEAGDADVGTVSGPAADLPCRRGEGRQPERRT